MRFPIRTFSYASAVIFLSANLIMSAPRGAMRHEGRTQAIVNEYLIPPPTLPYNHEGTMSVMRNGNIINTWQASHCEGCKFGFAMMNIFDGTKWMRYSRKADAGDYNWTPVPYQPKKAGAPLLLFVHINGGWGGPETFVKTSYDNGWTWDQKVRTPVVETQPTFWTNRTQGTAYPAMYTKPLELPDGSLLAGSNAYNPHITRIPANNYTGSEPGGDPWTLLTPQQYPPNSSSTAGELGGPVLPHSDDYSELQYIIWAWGGKTLRTCWSNDKGQSWDPWTTYTGAGCDHVHAVALDWDNGGPLKGWYAIVYDGGSRKSFDVAISQDGETWQNVLNLGQKGQGMKWHSELTGQGIVQTPDRKLHVTSAGRGGFYVWHVVLDPDILVNNTVADNSGSIVFCGSALKGNEVSDSQDGIAFTVVRNGGSQGAASVKYTTVDGDARAGSDYESTTGTLNWSDGDNSSKTIYVPIKDDSDAEGTEEFHVALYDAAGAQMGAVDTMDIIVQDGGNRAKFQGDSPDGSGLLQFSHREFFSYEDAIDETLWVVIERPQYDQRASKEVSVTYTTSDGTAQSGKDYTTTSGTVTWPMVNQDRAATGAKNIGIPINPDASFSGNKHFFIELSNPTNGAVLATRSKVKCVLVEKEQGIATSRHSRNSTGRAISEQLSFKYVAQHTMSMYLPVSISGSISIGIFDVNGRNVKSFEFGDARTTAGVNLDMHDIPAGVYVARLRLPHADGLHHRFVLR
ncbi:MAG: hypothetical protein GF398_04320 [Chitinivibrionales bacterium]|nr:hypothetical protein [Chitinivibrionales bacterium]